MKKKLLYSLLPATAWTVLIFILLVIPAQDLPEAPRFPFLDKIVHFFLFGVQVFLWCRFGNRVTNRNILWIFFLLSCIYGIGMEYVQKYWVANRSFEGEDILADIAGSLVGWIIYRLFFSKAGGIHKKIGLYRNRGRNQN